ncbi:MAG: hypothetical protein IPG68_16200 [Micrococcales bacterium]|nr:hypothetical protein [Micrococcales bacterium]
MEVVAEVWAPASTGAAHSFGATSDPLVAKLATYPGGPHTAVLRRDGRLPVAGTGALFAATIDPWKAPGA